MQRQQAQTLLSRYEFVNRNHTPTSAHPNAVAPGEFLADMREPSKLLKGANDFPSLATEDFRTGVRMRRDKLAAGDSAAKQAMDLIGRWTGAQNIIKDIRRNPEAWKPAVDYLKSIAVKNDVPLYRSIDFGLASELKAGDRIPNRVVSSFTEKERYMQGFRDTRIIIQPGKAHGVPVAWVSNTPHEAEWLVLSDFKVVSVETKLDYGGFDTVKEIIVQETKTPPLKKWAID